MKNQATDCLSGWVGVLIKVFSQHSEIDNADSDSASSGDHSMNRDGSETFSIRFELSTSEFLRWAEAELVPIIAKRVAQQIQVKELSPTRHAELPPGVSDKKQMSIASSEKMLVSKREASQMLSISQRAIDYYITNKVLPFRRVGSRVLIPVSAVKRFAAQNHYGSCAATPLS